MINYASAYEEEMVLQRVHTTKLLKLQYHFCFLVHFI